MELLNFIENFFVELWITIIFVDVISIQNLNFNRYTTTLL